MALTKDQLWVIEQLASIIKLATASGKREECERCAHVVEQYKLHDGTQKDKLIQLIASDIRKSCPVTSENGAKNG